MCARADPCSPPGGGGRGSRPADWGWEALWSPLGWNTGEQSRSSRQRRGPGWDGAVGEGSTGEGRPGSSKCFGCDPRVTAPEGGSSRTRGQGQDWLSQEQTPEEHRQPQPLSRYMDTLSQPASCLPPGSPLNPWPGLTHTPALQPPRELSVEAALGFPLLPFLFSQNSPSCMGQPPLHSWGQHRRLSLSLEILDPGPGPRVCTFVPGKAERPHGRCSELGSPFVISLTGACITHREREGRAPSCPPFGIWDRVTSLPPARGARASSPPWPSTCPASAPVSSVTGRSLQTSRPHVNRRAGAATHEAGRTPAHPKIQSPRKTRVLPNPQARLMGAMRHENVFPPQCFLGLGYLCGRRTPCQPPLSGGRSALRELRLWPSHPRVGFRVKTPSQGGHGTSLP